MTKNKSSAIKTIGLLCSGGDSPGMNCAIRAVVRTAIGENLNVIGIQKGYMGLLEGHFRKMDLSSVGNIIQRGGTILQTSRCPEFHQQEARKEAANILKRNKIDALIVIGGDGSFMGASLLSKENQLPVIGIPGTIDNDISGTQYSIGFDTAVQTCIDAVDKIRDTAFSHERTFIVEVMGRRSSAIAVHVGMCTGAENIVISHKNVDIKQIAADIKRGIERGKNSSIIIVAEGDSPGQLSYSIQEQLKSLFEINASVCVLGHTQRGGSPTGIDRFIASRMGFEAVKSLVKGQQYLVTAFIQGEVTTVSLDQCLSKRDDYETRYIEELKALSI
jgi:6-phosphofructokinase 1